MNCHQWSTQDHFVHEVSVDAWYGEKKVSSRHWREEIERDLV